MLKYRNVALSTEIKFYSWSADITKTKTEIKLHLS